MPLTVNELFEKVGLVPSAAIKWKDSVLANENGVYVVSMSSDPAKNYSLQLCEIDEMIFDKWREKSSNLEVGGVVSKQVIEEELNRFWNPNENILYIGESSSPTNGLGKRVRQFYSHIPGSKGPHTGGYWVKLLSNLSDLFVYHAPCRNPRDTEFKMLMFFVEQVTSKSFYELDEIGKHLPFANLKADFQKKHSIRNAVSKIKK